MKEKINQFAKSIFDYDNAALQVEPELLELEVASGENCKGSFKVTNTKNKVMKGIISTDSHYLVFDKDSFQGEENEITFHFTGRKFLPGEVVKGIIRVITDCGTKKLPFSVTIGVPSCTVSSGKIKDLFHFTNLARENSMEAAKLFKSSHFEDVFLYKDSANIALYRGLSLGTSKGLAMEEFLIAIHKKLPIQLTVNQTNFSYDSCTEKFKDEIVISKDNWGYGEFHITSDAEFIIPEHKIVWTDNFIGDRYPLSFVVDPEKMISGRNYGRIMITSVRQTIVIDITAVKPGILHQDVEKNVRTKKVLSQLSELYLEFCMNRMDKKSYIAEVEKLVCTMEKSGQPIVTELFRIHMGIMDGREDTVQNGLEHMKDLEEVLLENQPKLYCAYQYLLGLWENVPQVRQECIENIKDCYREQEHSWQILWFLLCLDPVYETERHRYEIVHEQIQKGCYSPVMFFEICNILNHSPAMLQNLDMAILQSLHWGCKKGFLEKEVALRYVYLAGKQRTYSKIIFRDLEKIYEMYQEEEVLTTICKMLMKGQMTSSEAFRWYALGIRHNLKITELYEYYMYALDETKEIQLTHGVLLYFLYDNHLTMNKRAMLYRYVIQNKEKEPDIYKDYCPVMKEFCMRQLKEGRINANLAVIYEEFINEETLDEDVAAWLPKVMFCHEIRCQNPDITGVYVRHRELKQEEFVPMVQGRAVVSVFTEQAKVFLADKLDNRYVLSIDYTDNKMLHLDHLAEKCQEKNKEDYKLLLHLYDKADHLHQLGPEAAEIRRRVVSMPELSEYQRRKVFSALLRYYFDNFEGELLDAELEQMDWEQVTVSDREQFIEYCAVRHCYDKAMEGIRLFGYEKLDEKRLLQISAGSFKENGKKTDEMLVKLAWHIFKAGKFDENVLKYLCNYFQGTVQEMIEIWKVANGFGIATENFEERLLAQVVFSEEMVPETYEVYYHYYEHGTNKRLNHAFMKFLAYKYLVQNWMIEGRMFEYFAKEVRMQEDLPCLIAVLKFNSQKKALTEEELNFADYHVNHLYEKGIIFPFYKDYHGKFALPVHLMDEYYVEYTANPDYEVKIHYAIASKTGATEYVTETMHNVFEGIRVKEFVLFQDEILQYYISEIRPEGEVITKSASVRFDETMDNSRTSSRYHMLNLMMIAQEMHDDTTLMQLMREYREKRESTKKLFRPLS